MRRNATTESIRFSNVPSLPCTGREAAMNNAWGTRRGDHVGVVTESEW